MSHFERSKDWEQTPSIKWPSSTGSRQSRTTAQTSHSTITMDQSMPPKSTTPLVTPFLPSTILQVNNCIYLAIMCPLLTRCHSVKRQKNNEVDISVRTALQLVGWVPQTSVEQAVEYCK